MTSESPADVLDRALGRMLARLDQQVLEDIESPIPYVLTHRNVSERAELVRKSRLWPDRCMISVHYQTSFKSQRCPSCKRTIAARTEYACFIGYQFDHPDDWAHAFEYCMQCTQMAKAIWGSEADIMMIRYSIKRRRAELIDRNKRLSRIATFTIWPAMIIGILACLL